MEDGRGDETHDAWCTYIMKSAPFVICFDLVLCISVAGGVGFGFGFGFASTALKGKEG